VSVRKCHLRYAATPPGLASQKWRAVCSLSARHLELDRALVTDQTITIEIEGDTITYERLREAERKFLARFRGEERENKLIEWKSGPIEGEGRHSEYRAYLPLSE
jgi:hypothetical protein